MDGQALSAVLSAVATFAVGLSVVLRQRMQRAFKQFVWLCLNVCTWHVVNAVFLALTPDEVEDKVMNPSLLIAALLPVTSIRFFRAFLNVEPRKISASRILYFVAAAFCAVLAYAALFPSRGIHQLVNLPFVLYILAGLSLSIFEIYAAWRRTLSRVDKTRLFYLLIGAVISVGFAAGLFVFPVVGNILITLYVYFLSQILLRYRLLDLNELLGRMAVLAVFASLVSVIYQVIFLIPARRDDTKTGILLTFVASCVVAVLFEPLWSRIEGEVNRWLFREKYELRQRVDDLRLALANIIDAREAIRVIMDSLGESRRATHAAVYLADQDLSGYDLAAHLGPRPVERVDAAARRPFFERITTHKGGGSRVARAARAGAGAPPTGRPAERDHRRDRAHARRDARGRGDPDRRRRAAPRRAVPEGRAPARSVRLRRDRALPGPRRADRHHAPELQALRAHEGARSPGRPR